MKLISPTAVLFCLFFLFFVVTLVKALVLKKQKDFFLLELTETKGSFDKMKEELKNLHEKQDKSEQFKNNLTAAQLTTQLQKPRLSAQTLRSASSIPEKYNFVHSLIQKNMGSEEIASILSISSHEAEQLVTLSKLGKAN